MKEESEKNPFEPIVRFFSRYNLVIFIVVIVGGLIVSVLTLTDISNMPFTETTSQTNQNQIIFDEATLQKIESLNSSNQNIHDGSTITSRTGLFSE